MPRCLIVDDDEILRTRLSRALARRGLEVQTAAGFDEGAKCLEELQPDFALIDMKMPGKTGLDFLKYLKEVSPTTKAVVLTGYGSIATAVEAMKLGAHHYLTKPADADEVLAAFEDRVAPPADEEDFQGPSLATAEWEHIQKVLADCDGNITEASRRLGIPRRTLQRKLKKLAP